MEWTFQAEKQKQLHDTVGSKNLLVVKQLHEEVEVLEEMIGKKDISRSRNWTKST